jgi:hypothetical protein
MDQNGFSVWRQLGDQPAETVSVPNPQLSKNRHYTYLPNTDECFESKSVEI